MPDADQDKGYVVKDKEIVTIETTLGTIRLL